MQGDDRLHARDQVLLGDEFLDGDRMARLVAEAAAGEDLEAELTVLLDRDDREVVEHALRAVGLAGREADLELARQVLGQRVAQEIAHRMLLVLADIDALARADTGERAAGDVAHGVVAGLARGQADAREILQRGRDLCDRHIVDLDVLARRDMGDVMLRIGLEHIGDRLELCRRHVTAGDLDANHVDPVLALAVDALLQSNRLEAFRIDLVTEEGLDVFLEAVQFFVVDQWLGVFHRGSPAIDTVAAVIAGLSAKNQRAQRARLIRSGRYDIRNGYIIKNNAMLYLYNLGVYQTGIV